MVQHVEIGMGEAQARAEIMTTVPVCNRCRGSGLEPCNWGPKCTPKHKCNNNVSAREHKKYVVCQLCKGEAK